jgi:tetratricopeptide (TPR) repeat protein
MGPHHARTGILLFLLSALTATAQVPRALPVDPAISPDAANDFFQRGRNLYDSAQKATDLQNRIGLYDRAAAIFSQYVEQFPDHPNAEMAWWYLGNSYYQSGRVEDGKRCFSALINRYRRGKWVAAAAYTLAADHYNRGEYAMAAPLFERYAANAVRPEEPPRGDYYAGTCYRLLGRDREAAIAFQRVMASPAGAAYAAQTRIALGHLSLKGGKLAEAFSLFSEVASQNHPPKIRGEAALQAAFTATKLGKTDDADRFLQLVLRTPGMEDFRAEAQTALMANLFARKQYDEVIRIFRSGTASASGEKEAARLMLAGRSYMKLKQPSQALSLFREIEKLLKPHDDTAFEASYHRLLCFYQIEGRHVPDQVDAFLQLYRRKRQDDPRIHTALMMKAESLYDAKETEAAAKAYNEVNAAIVSPANRPGLLYRRGWCLSEAGDHQGAVRSLSEFISSYPQDSRVPTAVAKRAKSYAATAESAKAVADYDRLTREKVPADLASHAWLESARLRRSEGNIPDMILRYRGLLQHAGNSAASVEAEANYWIGWGMVKSNELKGSVPHLEKARSLKPEAYGKHAGILLCLGYFASEDARKLADEIRIAIRKDYHGDIPDQALQWCGIQAYNGGDHTLAAECLSTIANPDEPRSTPKEVWRYLAKSLLETAKPAKALEAVDHCLAVEENPVWKADGLLDKGRALLALKRTADARKAADEALELRPQGRIGGGLRILTGDIEALSGDPDKAAAEYLYVVNFLEDRDLKPTALHRLATILERKGSTAEAAGYRKQLATEFPDWKAPRG